MTSADAKDYLSNRTKRTLPPLNGCQTGRAVFRNVLPDSPGFALRRYDCRPPIHQFSIESDTDLTETAELIEEYTVFDPMKARPWIILLIGRNEEEVFYDLSVAVDNKLFPTKEPVAGPSELDLSFLLDSTEEVDVETETEDQRNEEPTTPTDCKTKEDLKARPIIFVIGDASPGRGTQCDRVAAEYSFTHLRVRDLVKTAPALGEVSSEDVGQSGEWEQLVPRILKVSIICGVEATGFIIDGYPWTVEQAVEFERKIVRPSLVLQMSCSVDSMHQRPLEATQASGCTPAADQSVTECSGPYQSLEQAVLDKYRMENMIHKINAEEETAKIFHQMCNAIDAVQQSKTINVTSDRFLCREQ